MEKKKIAILTIVIFVVGLIITGASYAFWSWTSNVNKNVVFNTASNLRNYIIYNEGESAFTGELNVSNSYQTGSIHSTISIYKTTDVNLLATIHMDINRIGPNMKVSRALKWVVTEGTSSNPGTVLAQGNFVGTNNGDVLTLVPDIPVNTTETFYTIWIWLDSSENPSDNLSGETLDTNVWTEINQAEGSEDRYEITNTDANYQQISATVVDSKYKVTKYAVTQTNTEPSSWTTITPATDQNNVYTLNTSVESSGTYYVWFKDANDRTTSKEIQINNVDTTGPTCTWGTFDPATIENNITSNITLTCTDSESSISIHNLQATDITPSNNKIIVTNITKSAVTNGYQYTITVTGTTSNGTATLTLNADSIKNATGYGNLDVTSGEITVDNPHVDITGGSEKIYGYSDTVLTCSYNRNYEAGYTGYYQFGYSATSNGTITWLEATTNTTLTVSKTEFVGTRYYHCKSYASDGNTSTSTLTSTTPTTMTLNRVAITLDATTNGGTLSSTSSPVYVGYEGTDLYTTATGDTTVIPNATKTGSSLSGWYTAASGETMVIDDNGIVQSSITDYTNQDGKLIITSNITLYAQYKEGYYENVDTGNTYTSLSAAFSAVASGETIKVLTSKTEITNATLESDVSEVKLDLNGKTITMGTYYIINNGELDIYNSSPKPAYLYGQNSSSIIINNGTLTTNGTSSTNQLTIRNNGVSYNTRVINNNAGKEATLNSNTTLILTSSNSSTSTSYSYYRRVINNSGTLYIKGATITNTVGTRVNDIGIYIDNAAGRVVMSSGTLSARGYAIYNRSGTGTTTPAMDISGGNITSMDSNGIYNYTSGKIKISGGTITGTGGPGIYSGGGAVEISGGSVAGSDYGIQSTNGTLTITGGTIMGSTYGIYKSKSGTITLGEDEAEVSQTSPKIYGGSKAIYITYSTATWDYYDGVLYSTESSYANKGYTNIASGYLPITVADDYGYKTYLGEPTYTATFYYNSNTSSGSTTVSSIKSGCITQEGSSTCDVGIPVKSSGGTYNNVYAGLSNSTGTMIATIPSTDETITISEDVTYYAVYSSPVTIYYPDTTTTQSSEIAYRNQWFSSTSAMAATVLSTTSTGTTADYVFTSNISEYDLYGFATAASSVSRSYAAVTNLQNSNATTVYAILYKEANGTFYYYDGIDQATTTVTANQYVRCTASAAEIYNTTYTVPTVVITSTGPGGNVYKGVSTVPNSMTTTTTINTSTTTYYAVYGGDFTASFVKENDNVSSIGSTSLSCSGYDTTDGTTYSGATCSITLPSITVASGYDVLGWFNGLGLIGQPNTVYVLTSNATYTAKAGILKARDFYYDNTNTGVECSDVQCMIDYLDSGNQGNATLSLGDYVSYTPSKTSYTTDLAYTGYTSTQTINPSELTLWRVISLNDDGTVDIISEYVSSVNVSFRGLTGYKNLVGYLNVLASQYENNGYTVGSRYFGYNGQTLSITSDKYFVNTAPWTCSTGGTCSPNPDDYEEYGGGDTGYLKDYDLVYDVLGTRKAYKVGTSTATDYWMASRLYYNSSSAYYHWTGRYVNTSGSQIIGVNSGYALYHYYSGSFTDGSQIRALRPIVTLKSGLTYTGSGTSDNPWVINSN